MNADGTAVKRLTHLASPQSAEEWFPNDWILVTDWRAGGSNPDWILIRADGTDMISVPELDSVSQPLDWRP